MRTTLPRLLLLALGCAWLYGADEAPEWARQAAATTVPAYPAKVTSVFLFQEETVAVDADGKRVMRERGAIKILEASGEKIDAFRTYNTKTGRIRDFQGWLFPPTGKPIPYAKNRVADVALSQEYVYDEARAKVLECGSAAPGSVFAWEVTEEERSVFTQDAYHFQRRSPVLLSRFVLTLPVGWEVKGVVFNHEQAEPQVSGNTYTWEMRNLPWMENENYSPGLDALVPRLAVSFFPPADNRAGLEGLKDWHAVSAWLSLLVDPAAEVTDAIRAKSLELTANAPGELDKIRAIAAFTQQTNYVEVALNVTRGGGYTPRRAAETLARNYGDCNDKATLMRALLKAAGIESYLTTITANDRTYVRQEWASPMQFNHAIVAVRVSDAISLPTVLADRALGRLLIFDPTDRMTPVGDLPEEEQGSHALVIAGARGALLTMPLLPSSANRIDSSVEGAVDPAGRLDARIERQYFGQSAATLRRVETLRGSEELKKRLERGFARRIAATTVRGVTTAANPAENRLALNVELGAERFAQIMQGRLLVVRAGLLSSGGDYLFTSKERSSPVKLQADLRRDSIRLKLPAGFQPDELPPPVKIESTYGTLEAVWLVKDGELLMTQLLEVRAQVVQTAEYAQVREFFEQVAAAGFAPVVLVKR